MAEMIDANENPPKDEPKDLKFEELLDKKVSVLLRDGRNLIGYLKSVDQDLNLTLHRTNERYQFGKEYADVSRGVYEIRGENVLSMGEDQEKESNSPLTETPLVAILMCKMKEQEEIDRQNKLRSYALKLKGLTKDK